MSDLEIIREAIRAQDVVLNAVQSIRALAALSSADVTKMPPGRPAPPSGEVLQKAFDTLGVADPARRIAPVRHGTLYGAVRGGFASSLVGPRLRNVRNFGGEPIGEQLFDWMRGELSAHHIELALLEPLAPASAVDWSTKWIRASLAGAGITSCDPENLDLRACRGPYPDDTEPITMVTVVGDFPHTVAHLAQIYDPRQWDKNPYAAHFVDVRPVVDVFGNPRPVPRPEPIGTTWSCALPNPVGAGPAPCWISEKVTGPSGASLTNTLQIQFVVTADWIRLTYALGQTITASSTFTLERDFGYLAVDPVAGRPGWCRIRLEKNIRFSGITGTSGGDIGWGDLANLIAPDLIAKWLSDMRYMPCWDLT